jgi:hypothetical protein
MSGERLARELTIVPISTIAVVASVLLSFSTAKAEPQGAGAAAGQLQAEAARSVRVGWSHRPYRDVTCFDALEHAVPCDSIDVARVSEEAGEEVNVTVANRTQARLDCSIRGHGRRSVFRLAPRGVSNNVMVKLPSSSSEQLVRVVCQAAPTTGVAPQPQAPVTFVYDYRTGKVQ